MTEENQTLPPGKRLNPSERRIRTLLILVLIVLLVAIGTLIYRFIEQQRELEQLAFASAQQQAMQAAAQLDTVFTGVRGIADSIAGDLSDGTITYRGIDVRMTQELRNRPDLDGIAVTFEPYVYDPAQRLYQSYHYYDGSGQIQTLTGATYDYTALPNSSPSSPVTAWYNTPLRSGPTWNEPFFASGAQKVLIEYGVPFYERDNPDVPAGVVTIDYSLEGMRRLMSNLELGDTGYGLVLSQNGTFLATPVTDLVGKATIYDYARANGFTNLPAAADRALAGESFSAEVNDPVSGERSWLFFEPIPSTGWTVGVVLNQGELLPTASQVLYEWTILILMIGAAVVIGVALLARVERGTTRSLWIVTNIYTLVCVVMILIVLAVVLTSGYVGGTAVASLASVNSYIQGTVAELPPGETLTVIPTGITLETMSFSGPTTAEVNGYVWQRIPADAPDDLVPGIQFPNINSEIWPNTEMSRVETAQDTLIVWRFGISVLQEFSPDGFPFDIRTLALRLEPEDMRYPILLAPDLDSYVLINPLLLPGLSPDMHVNNWSLKSSLFTYNAPRETGGLDIPELAATQPGSDLVFNVNLERNYVGPMIAFLLPGLVAAGMIFIFILSDPKVGDQEEILSTLGFAAAIFFVIAVAHAALRDSIAAVGVTYLEYFYLTLYVVIILATLNAFLLVRTDWKWLHYRNNLVTRVLYWPFIGTIMLAATLSTFVVS